MVSESVEELGFRVRLEVLELGLRVWLRVAARLTMEMDLVWELMVGEGVGVGAAAGGAMLAISTVPTSFQIFSRDQRPGLEPAKPHILRCVSVPEGQEVLGLHPLGLGTLGLDQVVLKSCTMFLTRPEKWRRLKEGGGPGRPLARLPGVRCLRRFGCRGAFASWWAAFS